jgi:ELWxxDGT repeat protein
MIDQLEPRFMLAAQVQTLGSDASDFFNANGKLLFLANNGGGSFRQPWISDGSASGTHQLVEFGLGENTSSFAIGEYISFKGATYFSATNGDVGELWKTDGTDAGTKLVKRLDPPPEFVSGFPVDFAISNGTLYFGSGTSLYKSDGTTNGTVLVKTVPGQNEIEQVTAAGNLVYFTVDLEDGPQLWVSAGTADGTVLLKQFPKVFAFNVDEVGLTLKSFNQQLYFINRAKGESQLWKSDGTADGTVQLKDLNLTGDIDFFASIARIGKSLFFTSKETSQGVAL